MRKLTLHLLLLTFMKLVATSVLNNEYKNDNVRYGNKNLLGRIASASAQKRVEVSKEHLDEARAMSDKYTDMCSKNDGYPVECQCIAEDLQILQVNCFIAPARNLSNQTIRDVDPKTYKLEYLKLKARSNRHLTTFPVNIIKPLVNLKNVSLVWGHLNKLPSNAFSNLSQLRAIKLTENSIVELMPYAFANHPLLESIDLRFNNITSIDTNTFSKIQNLLQLDFAHNRLTSLNDSYFINLTKLKYLNLGNNHLDFIGNETFAGMGNLKKLILTANKLVLLGERIFVQMWNLMELSLDNNLIEEIETRAFEGLNCLVNLTLRNNKLKQLEPTLFNTAPAIHSLDLSVNLLTRITFQTILPLWTNFLKKDSSLLIDDNYLICNCHLDWVFEFYNLGKEIPGEYWKTLVCVFQKDLMNLNADGDEFQDYNEIISEWTSNKTKAILLKKLLKRHLILEQNPNKWPCPGMKTPVSNTTELPKYQPIASDFKNPPTPTEISEILIQSSSKTLSVTVPITLTLLLRAS